MTRDNRSFPNDDAQQNAACRVFDPNENWRFAWDLVILGLMTFEVFVTLYQLAFLSSVSLGLRVTNYVVDLCFLNDIFITFNTGFFLQDQGIWVVRRPRIAAAYLRFWFWLDVAALVPWDILAGRTSRIGLLRLLRLLRIVRIVRIFKAPIVLERLRKRVSISFKDALVIKYVFVLLALLHVEACALRISHDLIRRNRRHRNVATYLSTSFHLLRPKFQQGNFAVYVDCFDWAFQTLLGQSVYINTTEAIMSIVNNLIGVMYLSFLVSELANVMCNLDPAKNDYKQTVDMLNDYLQERYFPAEMKWQLRVYLAHSECLFRAKFRDSLLNRLSPPLQELVAHFMLGPIVSRVPFFSYAKQRVLGLAPGRVVHIVKARGEVARKAVIISILGHHLYTVRFLKDGLTETIEQSHISLVHEPPDVRRTFDNMNHITKIIITQFARAMSQLLYNGGDYVVRRRVSLTDTMFIIEQGQVVLFGADMTRPFAVQRHRDAGCFGDRDLATIAAGHSPQLCWYDARASKVTRLLLLRSEDFLNIISQPGYGDFYKYVQRYGVWANFKISFYKALKDGTLIARMRSIINQRSGLSETSPEEKLAQAAALEARMVGCARTHFQRLLSSALADNSKDIRDVYNHLRSTDTQLKNLEDKIDLLLQKTR